MRAHGQLLLQKDSLLNSPAEAVEELHQTASAAHCNMNKLKKLPKKIPKAPAALKKINFDDIQEGISTFSEGVSAVSESVSAVTEGVTAFTEGVQAVSGLMPSHSNGEETFY